MIIRGYKTSNITARLNVDIAVTELEDLINQYRLLRHSKLVDKVDITEDTVPQLDDLVARLCEFYDTNRTS
jgi:hypothetical protein